LKIKLNTTVLATPLKKINIQWESGCLKISMLHSSLFFFFFLLANIIGLNKTEKLCQIDTTQETPKQLNQNKIKQATSKYMKLSEI
jgi:hypothetical protein